MKENDSELIVLLNEAGAPIGSAPKLASHHSDTPRHLAFSCYIFNRAGKLLVTRRADTKKVWNGVWTNSCCGHPAPQEAIEHAVNRRVQYELGISIKNLQLVVADYRYRTPPFRGIVENEICPIYFAQSEDTPKLRSEEVAEYKWLSWDTYTKLMLSDTANTWSWWCKDQLKHLQHTPEIKVFISKQQPTRR